MPSNPFLALDPNPYTPLEDDCDIRTLVLEPAQSWSHSIQCQLRVISLLREEGRYYEAVSYCWDGDERTNLIEVDERPCYITDSLDGFLRYRRDKDQRVTLWIDAICINQDDSEEKQKQVQLMREIYLLSGRLTIWLGSPSGDTDLAMVAILTILQGDPDKMPYLDGDARQALTSLLDRPLWRRIWIVQEIVLGTLSSKEPAAILQCGDFIIAMPNFWEVITGIDNYQIENRQHFPSLQKIVDLLVLRISIGPSMLQSLKPPLSGRSSVSAPTILEMMAKYRQYDASDARDNVYGLLGISQPEDEFFRSIVVDYEVPASDLYHRAASFIIKRHRSLDLLKHCRGQALKGLPSWVPDWSYFRKGNLLSDPPAHNQENDLPQVKGSLGEGLEALEGRAEQACMVDSIGAITINADIIPTAHKHKESLIARIQDRYFYCIRKYASPSLSSLSIEDNVLWTKAIILDELKVVHAPFPNELKVRWEACTELMVAVGMCKYSALHRNKEEPNPYLTPSGKEIAFWTAIFGCDLYGERTDLRSLIESNYEKWLPLVPKTWQIQNPRVTVLSSGLLVIGLGAASAAADCDEELEVGQGMQINLIPRDWDEDKVAFFRLRFNALGQTWITQPYDLHSRPFNLPNVVPDPYLESRPTKYDNRSKMHDQLKAQSIINDNVVFEDKEVAVPRVFLCLPQDDVGQGPYSAALGRSFFITSHGYMGLAPPDAQSGDRVVLLDGSRFPFILRKIRSSCLASPSWELWLTPRWSRRDAETYQSKELP